MTIREVDTQHMFSLAELAEALSEKKAVVVSQPDMTVREVDTQHMFSLAELAEALSDKKAIVVSQPGQKVARIDDLTLSLMPTSVQKVYFQKRIQIE